MTLEPGDAAPSVDAVNQDGERVSVDLDGPVVLYFYPKDQTPGCTTEARQFERERESYEAAGVAIYGISTDDVDDHAAFCEAEGLGFDLLADPEGALAEAFGVSLRRGVAPRTTFVVVDGEVHAVYRDVDPDGHARAVLADLLDDGVVELPD
ncbi:MAG: peroxiredoxin [Halobacteriales archaeon]